MSFVPTATAVLNYWVRILAALEKKINRQSYETWLKPTRFSHLEGKKLFVRIPSSDFQHIGDRYADLIQEAIDNLGLDVETVTFTTPEQDPRTPKVREDGGFAPVPSHSQSAPRQGRIGNQLSGQAGATSGPAPEQARFDWSAASQLNPRYQFDDFVIGSGNQFAMAAAQRRRRASIQGLQPPLPLRRRRHGQDPPDARHRPRCEAPPAPCHRQLRRRRKVYQRDDQLGPLRQDDRLPRQVPQRRRPAHRRHSVSRRQGAHPGGVLPHLQHPPRAA